MGVRGPILPPGLRQVTVAFERVAPQLVQARPEAVFGTLAGIALECVPGAAAASISTFDGQHFVTVAATNDRARRADAIQYEVGSGPCIAAIMDDGLRRPADLRRDGAFAASGPRIDAECGFAAVVSNRLPDAVLATGLNLYAERLESFDDEAVASAQLVTLYGGMALSAAISLSRAEHLERALQSSREIGTAIGVLMAQHKLPRDQAFDLLRTTSQHLNRKIRDIAAVVADTGALPDPLPTRCRPTGHRP